MARPAFAPDLYGVGSVGGHVPASARVGFHPWIPEERARRQTAAGSLALQYAFLQEQRYDGDYYDLAVMGYLRAVERYCSHAYLRRFSFSTVAYRAMQQSIVSWKRGESRRRQAEEAYCALCGRRETVCDAELSEAYFFSELQECGTPQQAAFALLRLHGYSIAEIAARYKLDPRRVRRMLKSLYSAYLRFRGDGKEAKK